MCSVLDPMAQDISEQDIVMGEQELPPQMDPKPKMATVYDTSPPPLHQNPPILLGQSALDIILQAIEANTRKMEGMSKEMEANMKEKMDGNTKKRKRKWMETQTRWKECGGRCRTWVQAYRRDLNNLRSGMGNCDGQRVGGDA